MWLFRAATLWLFLLSSCSFKPLYQKESLDQVIGKVDVLVTGGNSEEVRELAGSLEKAFAYKTSSVHRTKPYRLEVTVNDTVSDFAISRYSYSTRRKVLVSVNFKIIDNNNLQILDEGNFSDFSSFDLSQASDYSNDIGADYAARNNIKTLTDQLVTRCVAIITKKSVIQNAN